MISETRFWKQPLLRSASWLEHWRMNEAHFERDSARIERETFCNDPVTRDDAVWPNV